MPISATPSFFPFRVHLLRADCKTQPIAVIVWHWDKHFFA